jgi:hypothetical protein
VIRNSGKRFRRPAIRFHYPSIDASRVMHSSGRRFQGAISARRVF